MHWITESLIYPILHAVFRFCFSLPLVLCLFCVHSFCFFMLCTRTLYVFLYTFHCFFRTNAWLSCFHQPHVSLQVVRLRANAAGRFSHRLASGRYPWNAGKHHAILGTLPVTCRQLGVFFGGVGNDKDGWITMGELGETLKMHNLKQEKGQKLEMLQMFIYYILHSYLSQSCTVSSFLPFLTLLQMVCRKNWSWITGVQHSAFKIHCRMSWDVSRKGVCSLKLTARPWK